MRVLLSLLLLASACGSSTNSSGTNNTAKPAALTRAEGPSGTLEISDGGSADIPVVFVHGLGGDHHVWDETLAHLRSNRRAVAFDLHGFGKSTVGTTFDVASHAADLEAVVRAIGAPKVVVVGHSYGGFVVSEYAAKHAETVAGVVLVDPSGDFEAMPMDARKPIETMFRDQPEQAIGFMLQGSAAGVSERIVATFKTTDKTAFTKTFEALVAWDPKPAVIAYRGPRIMVLAPFMNDFPAALHKVVPGIDVKLIAGASHWPFLDKPTEWFAILDEFLGRAK